MKIEVGRSYKNRNGDYVILVAKKYGVFPFEDDMRNTYTQEGKYSVGVTTSPKDLVEDITDA